MRHASLSRHPLSALRSHPLRQPGLRRTSVVFLHRTPIHPFPNLHRVAVLKSSASVSVSAKMAGWLWEVLEEFNAEQRSLFLQFVWGRSRMPNRLVQSLNVGSGGSHARARVAKVVASLREAGRGHQPMRQSWPD